MKQLYCLLLVSGLFFSTCLPMSRENLEKTLDNEVFKTLFSKSELVEIGGRYASYGDSVKKRLLATAPSWAVGLIIGFSSNVLPTENKTLAESNIMGGLGLVAVGGTLKAIGGEDVNEALQKLHHSSGNEVVIAAGAGYITGALLGRLINKSGRTITKGVITSTQCGYHATKCAGSYCWQVTQPARDYGWQKLVNTINAIKLKLRGRTEPVEVPRDVDASTPVSTELRCVESTPVFNS